MTRSQRGSFSTGHSEREPGLIGKVQEAQYADICNVELGCIGGRANEVGRDRSKTLVCHAEEFGVYSESSEEPLTDIQQVDIIDLVL